ncbi:CbiX/SirB N-terminal domain-containing protein [Albidovulum sediminis]|uniref:Cobalamin biosynthesis protein CbiX n=1 Tax=Albidovulum sediminis TaxID=3066345 RepID=A0ABT2NNR3_9RHOB|nr:CbiX/SirB N-terminal domain-containing protein [Defluviimonas sediminis]MCT8330578.1 cobalamin biosynthesis protein CbiX [Defluviimonas sediminis]
MSHDALIVAHGQPSDPAPAEADMARLGEAVAALLPGWRVRAVTLAAPGALDQAVRGLSAARVLPFFMADGWFTRTELPRRLASAGAEGFTTLPAFGLMPEAAALAARTAGEAVREQDWRTEETTLVLAAHGSGRSRAPSEAAGRIRDAIAEALPFRAIRLGFIEEAPSVADAARDAGAKAICLPLFVARWGHVVADLPAELGAAGFSGPSLPPLGTLPGVPAILAAAIRG